MKTARFRSTHRPTPTRLPTQNLGSREIRLPIHEAGHDRYGCRNSVPLFMKMERTSLSISKTRPTASVQVTLEVSSPAYARGDRSDPLLQLQWPGRFSCFGMNEIHRVKAGDIVFVDHPKYYEKALQSAATVYDQSKGQRPKASALFSDDPFGDLMNSLSVSHLTEHFSRASI